MHRSYTLYMTVFFMNGVIFNFADYTPQCVFVLTIGCSLEAPT